MPKDKSKSASPSAVDFTYLLKVASGGDVTIACGKAKEVTCHSCVLIARTPALFKGAKGTGVAKVIPKKGGTIINLEEAPQHAEPSALNTVLEYLYTAKVDLPKSITHTLYVGVLAREWRLERLRWHVESTLRNSLDIKNIFEAISVADSLGDEKLKLLCVVFAVSHWVEVTQNMMDLTTGQGKLPMGLFAELVKLQTAPPTVEDPPAEPEETILEDFKKLYETKEGAEDVLAVGKHQIKVHRPILAARSDQMATLFEPPKKDARDPLRNLKPASFETLLRYLYYKDENIDPSAASDLVPFCAQFGLGDLQAACEQNIKSNIEHDTCLEILAVAYDKTTKKELQDEIKGRAIKFIVDELPALNLEPLRKMDPVIAVDILLACQQKEGGHTSPKPEASKKTDSAKKIEKTPSKRDAKKEKK